MKDESAAYLEFLNEEVSGLLVSADIGLTLSRLRSLLLSMTTMTTSWKKRVF